MAHLSHTNRLPSWNSILLQIFLLIMCCQSSFTQVRDCLILSLDITNVKWKVAISIYLATKRITKDDHLSIKYNIRRQS